MCLIIDVSSQAQESNGFAHVNVAVVDSAMVITVAKGKRNNNKRRRNTIPISDDDSDHDRADQIEQLSDASSDSFEPCSARTEETNPHRSGSPFVKQLANQSSLAPESCQHSSRSWIDVFDDVSAQSGLLISSRKSNEIREWLKQALYSTGSRFLILGGPPGCGKSSALRVICAELDCTLVTWQAPVSERGSISNALLEDLREFVVGTRYASFEMDDSVDIGVEGLTLDQRPIKTTAYRVLMIDDLPVTSTDAKRYRDALRDIMRHAADFAPHPTVLVLSDSAKGIARTVRLVLGLDFIASSTIACINIPSVTDNMMRTRLRDVAAHQHITILQRAVDDVVATCAGDFRAALNSLQFSANASGVGTTDASRQDRSFFRVRQHRKRSRHIPTINPSIARVVDVGADSTISTYHAVSKVLNNKRDEHGQSKYNPENILLDARVEASNFLEFIHHNYPEFFGNCDDIVQALECLSIADTLLPWRQEDDIHTMLNECAASIVIRGFFLYNTAPVQSGWRPIRGPVSYEVGCDAREHALVARQYLLPLTTPQVHSAVDTCETLPYVEVMWKRPLKPWGISQHYNPRNNMVDSAEVAMVDAETLRRKRRFGGRSLKSQQHGFRHSGLEQSCIGETCDEDIEEWDDED